MVHYLLNDDWRTITKNNKHWIGLAKTYTPEIEATITISELIPNQGLVTISLFVGNNEVYNHAESPVNLNILKKLISNLQREAFNRTNDHLEEIHQTLWKIAIWVLDGRS